MSIADYLRDFISKIKDSRRKKLLLDVPKNKYDDLLKSSRITSILNGMPSDLSKIEKAYYIYIELGKIINEDPKYVLNNRTIKEQNYNNDINERYYGICKSISELYASILRDEKIGIEADVVREFDDSNISHVDTILNIDGKNYITNLIVDLQRIKTSRKLSKFCFNLGDIKENESADEIRNKIYLRKLKGYYGKIDYLSSKEIEELDKKLGYSCFVPKISSSNEARLYTEDVIEVLKKEIHNTETFKEYVLQGKDIEKEEILKYKLDYIFKNIDKFTEFNGEQGYLENIRYYNYLFKELLSKNEFSRIHSYAAIKEDDYSEIVSILKVKPQKNAKENKNIYYSYSDKDKKYIERTPEEIKKLVQELEKEPFKFIKPFEGTNKRDIQELEI